MKVLTYLVLFFFTAEASKLKLSDFEGDCHISYSTRVPLKIQRKGDV